MLGLVGALAWPAKAHAQDAHDAVSGGAFIGVTFGERAMGVFGLDFRYAYEPLPRGGSAGFGPFGQAALLFDSTGVGGRFALGAHGGASLGFVGADGELGWTYRTALRGTCTLAASPGRHGVHLGLLVPIMYFGDLSFRLAIPVGAPDSASDEGTVVAGARFGPVYGIPQPQGTGRPLLIEGRPAIAPLVVGARRGPGAGPGDAATREALAEAWLATAQAEAASVPTFLALARDLALVGAPSALVTRAFVAAEEEVGHAVLCAAIAARLSGVPKVPEILDVPPPLDERREELLVRLAVESWRDGCVGEGQGAAQARAALAGADDPLVRGTLARIAIEEQGHAELAWAIVRFCVARGGSVVGAALASQPGHVRVAA